LFDWFRCPALEVIVAPGEWLSIERIRPRNITRLANGEGAFLREALHQHTKREWRDPKARTIAKYDLAVLIIFLAKAQSYLLGLLITIKYVQVKYFPLFIKTTCL